MMIRISILLISQIYFCHEAFSEDLTSNNTSSEQVKNNRFIDSVQDFWESYIGEDQKKAKEIHSDISIEHIPSDNNTYNYASFGKENPFIPPLLSAHLTKTEIPVISILQKYPVEHIRVVGIWTLEDGSRKSLMMSRENEGVITSIGDPVGNHGGKVISIEEKIVKVREFSLSPDGTRQFTDVDLWLGDEEPESPEKIIIESSELSSEARKENFSSDFMNSSSKEQHRMINIMNHANNSLIINKPADPDGSGTTKMPGQNLPPLNPEAGAMIETPVN
ncbi:MAG: hypothetical protein H6618_04175 [Deltaproteobacteria bacterium]|nr:hypothetical protein [Deltaproteobacteria bacterium]